MGGGGNAEGPLPDGAGRMDVATFLSSLLDALADRSFVRSVDLDTEVVIVKGRVFLEQDRFLQVYFNEQTGTMAFALIEDDERIWGVDYDELRGWHLHPVDRPTHHQAVEPMTPADVVEALADVWDRLP